LNEKVNFYLAADRALDSRIVRELNRNNFVRSKGNGSSNENCYGSDFIGVNTQNAIGSIDVGEHVGDFKSSGGVSTGWCEIADNLITLIDNWYLIDDAVGEDCYKT